MHLRYCFQPLYIAQPAQQSCSRSPFLRRSTGDLLCCRYRPPVDGLLALDQANYHKYHFRMVQRGEIIERNLFPTFRHVKDPKYIECDVGVLLIDGWYGVARRIHYAADSAMALLWGLGRGFGSLMPFLT